MRGRAEHCHFWLAPVEPACQAINSCGLYIRAGEHLCHSSSQLPKPMQTCIVHPNHNTTGALGEKYC